MITRTIQALIAILFAAIPLRAEIDASILLADSPFVPEGWSTGGKGGLSDASQQYVFKGVYSIGEDTFVSISDSRSDKSDWIRIGDTKNGIKALNYDSLARKATILASGRELTLEMPKPKGNPIPAGAVVNSLAKNRNVPPGDISGRRNPRERRILSTPPWANNGKASRSSSKLKKTAQNTKSSSSDNSSSGSSGSSDSSSSGGSDTGDESSDTSTVPASPPSYVPTIPDNIKTMIESGQSPSK
jgi:hypothetical protein